MKKCFAHTARHQEDWEPLKTHLLNVAVRARQFASAFGAGVEGFSAGLIHDLGKYGERFQERLLNHEESIDKGG